MDEEAIRRALAAQLRRPGADAETLRARAMAAAVEALRGGATFKEAAARAGVAAKTLHAWRRGSPAFAEACAAAVAESDAPMLVVPRGGVAKWQIQRGGRRHRFTAERKADYLAHFGLTCDGAASARVAGVSVWTVNQHRRTDPDFAAEWQAAKERAYSHIEAELARLRIAGLERMREGGDTVPEGVAEEFDRALQLLREHKRWQAGGGAAPGRRPTRWSFDKALDALEKKLRAFGVRIAREQGEEGTVTVVGDCPSKEAGVAEAEVTVTSDGHSGEEGVA
ncbi:MAG TPA: hypothetical protein VGD66_03785 [Allosphingosinicella sp.]